MVTSYLMTIIQCANLVLDFDYIAFSGNNALDECFFSVAFFARYVNEALTRSSHAEHKRPHGNKPKDNKQM